MGKYRMTPFIFLDVPYKLFRKSLPNLIYVAGRHFLGRKKAFCSAEHALKIVNLYKGNILIKDKTILEIGPGNDISTAILMIMQGAKRVYLVDKISDLNDKGHNKDVEFIRAFQHEMMEEALIVEYPPQLIIDKIFFVDSYFTDSDPLFEALGGIKVDCIVSHQVLEHIDNLDEALKNMKTILKHDGSMFHEIDFSDHTMHIFSKYSFLNFLCRNHSLAHLYYSDRLWSVCNDANRLNMNRNILPDYLTLFERYGFTISSLFCRQVERKQKIHADILFRIEDRKHKKDDYHQLVSASIQIKCDK